MRSTAATTYSNGDNNQQQRQEYLDENAGFELKMRRCNLVCKIWDKNSASELGFKDWLRGMQIGACKNFFDAFACFFLDTTNGHSQPPPRACARASGLPHVALVASGSLSQRCGGGWAAEMKMRCERATKRKVECAHSGMGDFPIGRYAG